MNHENATPRIPEMAFLDRALRWLLAGLDAPAHAHADQAQAEAGEGAGLGDGLGRRRTAKTFLDGRCSEMPANKGAVPRFSKAQAPRST